MEGRSLLPGQTGAHAAKGRLGKNRADSASRIGPRILGLGHLAVRTAWEDIYREKAPTFTISLLVGPFVFA